MATSEDIRKGAEIGWRLLRDIGLGDRPRVVGGPGVGVVNLGGQVAMKNTASDARRRVVIDAQIILAIPFSPNKWTYIWGEAGLTANSTWFIKDPARNSSTHGVARNRYEIPNSDTGVQGNGVNVDNLVGTFALQPIAAGIVVRLELVPLADQSTIEAWISEPNGVDGQCRAAPSQNLTNQYLLSQHPPP